MLPTYPRLVALRRTANSDRMQALVKSISPLGMIDRHCLFEGAGQVIERHDETASEVDLASVTAELETPRDMPLAEFTYDRLDEMLVEISRQMARGTAEHGFDEIGKATAQVGNVVDGGGKPVSEDLLIDVFSRMEHTFHPDGSWQAPIIIGGPTAEIRAILETPSFQNRLKTILESKRDDFRHREADRVLAG